MVDLKIFLRKNTFLISESMIMNRALIFGLNFDGKECRISVQDMLILLKTISNQFLLGWVVKIIEIHLRCFIFRIIKVWIYNYLKDCSSKLRFPIEQEAWWIHHKVLIRIRFLDFNLSSLLLNTLEKQCAFAMHYPNLCILFLNGHLPGCNSLNCERVNLFPGLIGAFIIRLLFIEREIRLRHTVI